MKTLTNKELDLIDKLIQTQRDLTTLKLLNWSASDKKKKVEEEIDLILKIAKLFKS